MHKNNSTIFRTITDDVTGANKSIGLFGKSLNNIKDFIYSFKTNGIKNTLFNTPLTNIDTKAIDDYNKAIKTSMPFEQALAIARRTTNAETVALIESSNGATISTETLTAAQRASTLAAKAQSMALKAVSIAGNMIAFAVITKGIQLAATAIDHYVNRAKYAAEAMKEAQQKIGDAQSTLKSLSNTISQNKDRFLELSQGVSKFSKNLSLSEKDYAEYLSISNELTELSPSLVIGYDEQGNALLDIGNNAAETTQKLNELLETQQAISRQTLVDNLDNVAKGVYYEVEEIKGTITQLQQELAATQKEASELSIDIADIVENGNGIFQFNDVNDPLRKYRNTFIKALGSANIGWEDIGHDQIFVSDFSGAANNGGKDGYEVRDIALKEAQAYYNATLNLENNTHAASIAGLKKTLNEQENAVKASYSKMTSYLQAWVEDNYNYQYLSDNSQALVDALIPEIDWDSLGINLFSGEDYQNYINTNILTPLMSVKPEDKAEVEKLFTELLSFEDGDLNILSFAEQLKARLNELEISIDITPIIANEQDARDKLQNSIENIAHGKDYYTSSGNRVNAEDYRKLQEYTEGFTAEQIENWNKVTLGIDGADNAIQAYEYSLKSANGTNDVISSISQTIDQLNTQLKPAMDSLKSAYQDIFSDDGFALDSIDIISTCDSIKSKLDDMAELGLSVDYSSYEDFVRVLRNSESESDDVERAFDSLATSITQAALSGAEDFETMKAALEDLGVVNESIVAFQALAQNTEALKESGLVLRP